MESKTDGSVPGSPPVEGSSGFSRALRAWGGRLAVLAVASLLSLAGAELVVRLVQPQPINKYPAEIFEKDPTGRHRFVPGARGIVETVGEFRHSVALNSIGMRGPEIDAKGPQEVRVLVLGDSFTFGHGVEEKETFTALLREELLSEVPGIETLNGGVTGYGLPDELNWLRQYGLQLEPDLVVIAVCLANDILDANETRPLQEIFAYGFVQFWLGQHSHLYRLIERRTPDALRPYVLIPEPVDKEYFRQVIRAHTDESFSSATVRQGHEKNRVALAGFVELAEQHGFRLGAMLIPNDFHLQPLRWEGMLASLDFDPAAFDADAPRRFFLEALRDHGIPTVDLSPIVSERLEQGERLYYAYDPHWTPQGHHLAARSLGQLIWEEGLLPN